ncbi:MAG: phosphoribosylanthranilate isomerase [Dehalococcoidia bacterium]
MTKIKICGVQEVSHIIAAAKAGADFVGLVLAAESRHWLEPERAYQMVQSFRQEWGPGGPRLVGLFTDQPLEEVQRTAQSCGLDAVQLCGSESLDYCAQVGLPVLKVLHIDDRHPEQEVVAAASERLQAVEVSGYLAMLDRYDERVRGGTGRTFNWAIARELARQHRFLLAGGLTPENVQEAVRTVRPWGVDVSSGVETGGAKDPAKVRAFIAAVREAEGAHASP